MGRATLGLAVLSLAACQPGPIDAHCGPSATVRVAVDGVTWRIPMAAQPRFEREDHGRTFPMFWRSGRYIYCQDSGAAPLRQSVLRIGRRGLRRLAEGDPVRYSGLADLELLAVGGPVRLSALPNADRGEFFGPRLFGRPTIVWRQDIHVPSAGKIGHLDRLSGWAPGGVVVNVIYADGDIGASVRSVEILLSDLRETPPVK